MGTKKYYANYFNFTGGLNTEASPLKIEPTDLTDTFNVKLNIDGSLERRKGTDFIDEDSTTGSYIYNLAGKIVDSNLVYDAPSAVYWDNINSTGVRYPKIVIQVQDKLRVFTGDSTAFSQFSTYSQIDLGGTESSDGIVYNATQFAQDGNRLMYVNKYTHPSYLSTSGVGSATRTKFDITVREDNGTTAPTVVKFNSTDDLSTGDTRPSTVDFFQRRLWMSGYDKEPNTVWFSQTFVDVSSYGKMYQENDPYDATDPFVLATDGGDIVIAGADEIIGLKSTSTSMLVFARNGVWEITGSNGIFRADGFTVRQISNQGAVSRDAIIKMEDVVAYASENGIYVIQRASNLEIESKAVSLSDQKIQTFYNTIPTASKKGGRMVYDPDKKKLYFFINFNAIVSDINNPDSAPTYHKNILVYDIRLQSWYKAGIVESDDSVLGIGTAFIAPSTSSTEEQVITSASEAVNTATGEDVVINSSDVQDTFKEIYCIYTRFNSNGTDIDYGHGVLEGGELRDFYMSTAERTRFNAYFTSAHQTMGDSLRSKQANYINFIFERIEDGEENVHGEQFRTGGADLRAAFDYATAPLTIIDEFGNEKVTHVPYGRERDIYPKYRSGASILGNKTLGSEYLTYKHKVLGKGDVLQYHISDTTYDTAWKATADGVTVSPLVDSTDWEEIVYDPTYSEWTTVPYNTDDVVKITLDRDFKIIGWSSEMIVKERS